MDSSYMLPYMLSVSSPPASEMVSNPNPSISTVPSERKDATEMLRRARVGEGGFGGAGSMCGCSEISGRREGVKVWFRVRSGGGGSGW